MRLFKNKHTSITPQFWINYLAAFSNEKATSGLFSNNLYSLELKATRFVVIDTETTGLNSKTDRMLSIGAVAVVGNEISIDSSLEILIEQEQFNKDSVAIHGILKHGKYRKLTEIEALKSCLEFIGTSIIVGHHIGFDVSMINQALKRHGLGKLKNKTLDTALLYRRLIHPVNRSLHETSYSLDELAEALKIPLHDRHTAAGDAFITALAFMKIVHNLNSDGKLKVKHLFRR